MTIDTAQIDGPVWELVCQVLSDPDVIAAEVARQEEEGSGTLETERATIQRLLVDVIAKQKNATSAILVLDDEDAAAPVREALHALAERRRALEEERDALDQRAASAAEDRERLAAFGAWARRVSANLDALTYDERRLALEALAVNVEVFPAHDSEHPR